MIEGLKVEYSGAEIIDMATSSIKRIEKKSAEARKKVEEERAKYPGMDADKVTELLESLRFDAIYEVNRADNVIKRLRIIASRVVAADTFLLEVNDLYQNNLLDDDDGY